MKKIVQIIALLVLVIQNFAAPMVALAETVEPQDAVNPMALTRVEGQLINLDKSELTSAIPIENNGQYILKVKGDFTKETPEVENILLSVSSNFTIKAPTFAVVTPNQSVLGHGTATGNTLTLAISETVISGNEFVVEVPVEYHGAPELPTDALTLTSPLGNQLIDFNVALPEATEVTPEPEAAEEVEAVEKEDEEVAVEKEEVVEKEVTADKIKETKVKYPKDSKIDVKIITKAEIIFIPEKTNDEVTLESKIQFKLDWAFPEELFNEVEAGAFYEFELPKELIVTHEINNYPLKDGAGKIIAYASIDMGGKVKFVFTEEVESSENISGNFNFTTRINEKVVTSPQKVVITVPVKEKDKTITISVKSTANESIDKKGYLDKQLNPTNINWDIYVNKTKTELEGLTITDAVPAGLELKDVEVYEIDVDLDGNVINKELKKLTVGTDYEVNLVKGVVSFPGKTKKAYRIVYKTKIDEEQKNKESVPFTNKVVQTSTNGKKLSSTATVTAKYGKMLEKKLENHNGNKREFDWRVKYNYSEKAVSKDKAQIVDKFSENMTLVESSVVVTKMKADEQGNYHPDGQPLKLGEDYRIEYNNDQFEVKFLHDVNYAVNLTYQTKIKDGVIISDGGAEVTNKVSTEGAEDGEKVGVASNGLSKYARPDEYDYENETITWRMRVNQDLYEMNNWKLVDTFTNKGLIFLPNSFEMREITNKALGEKLILGTDYTLKGDVKDGFELELIGDYNPTSKSFEIVYQTKFDRNELTQKDLDFVNKAEATWTDKDGNDHKDHAESNARPKEETYNNGSKHGSYNAVSKEITWTVNTNFNRDTIANGRIEDPITGNQQYIPNSATLESFRVKKNGEIEILETITDFELKLEGEKDKKVLVVDLPKNTELGYRLTFKTSLKGQVIKDQSNYQNTAHLFDGKTEKDILVSTVEIKNGGSYVSKTGKVNDGRPSTSADWTILVNPSQSTLEKFVVKDYPSINQIIDENSVVITEAKVDEHGNVRHTDKKLTLNTDYELKLARDDETGAQTLTISFKGIINKTYHIDYKTDLMLAADDTEVSNRVEMSAENNETITQEVTSKDKVIHSEVGGGGRAERTKFFIKKVSLGADGVKTPLAGVELEVVNNKNKRIVLTKKTDEDGMVAVNGVTTGKYIIRELANPAGHFVSKEWSEGKEVTVTKEMDKPAVAIEIVNQKTRVELNKTNEAGAKLPGAIFKLSQKNSAGIYELALGHEKLTTNEAGKIVLEGLLPGDYRLEEVSAPAGYVLDTTPRDFTLTGQETDVLTLDNVINYQGSASLVKTDVDGKSLPGAEFTLTNLTDPTFKLVQTSDINGKVTFSGLAPGKYAVKETKAPKGYMLNETAETFEIKATANEPQVILLKTVVNYQGSAELIKKSEAGEVLANAEFKVYPAGATEAVTESLTSNKNGEVIATGLAPGNYYFKEVKAPAGYLLNTKEYGFTITAKAETKPTTIKVGNAINYQGSAQLVKRDDKGNPLADAEFKVTDEAGKTVESKLFSNAKGIVTVAGLAPGNYFFVETKAPTGFVTNDEKIGFTIPESNEGKHLLVLDKDLVNYQGSAQLIKKDEAGQRISGATFKVVDSNNKQVGEEIVSDEAGLVTVTGLAPGTYRFIETKPTPGFILNDTPRPFEIAANHEGQPTLVEAEDLVNYSGSVTLEKKSATNEVLTGVSFDLFRNENEKIGTYQTDENGKISVSNLESGSYYFLEVAAPTGYITNTEKIAFSIVEKATEKVEVVEVQATNYQGSAELIKVDGANKALAGAEFQVFEDKKETAVLKEVLISDKDGKVSVTGLAPGKYYFQETKAPSGYIRNTTKHEFTIEDKAAGEPKVVSVANVVNYQGSAHLIKTDKKGNALKDAVFNVIDSEDTVVRENLKSDEKGLVKVTGLAPGKYFFVETKAPAGFVINSTPVEFTIEEEVEGEPTAVTDLKLTNFKGSAQLIKKDESGTPVKGAKFNVLDADKELVATDLASDRDGVVTVTGLAAGKYYFVETQAPSGFMLNDTPQAFEIKNSYSGEPTLEQAGELINYRGRVILTKTTADEKTPLENASFKLYAEPDTIIGTYTTDVKGEIKVNDLAPGKYYFEETQVPNKYVRNTEKVNFQIKAEATTTPEIVELDMINYQGSAELTKKGEDNEALAGAIFKVTDEAGKDIATGLESDRLGKVFVDNLAPGTYYFVETQAAPGHILNEEKVGFKIASENPGKPVTVKAGDFKNYQGKVELFKTDADGKGLRDAIFKLTDAVGQTVQENLKTDKRGRLEVNKIVPGTYYFVETKAPAGYMLNETPIEFKINEKAGNTATVVTAGTVINYRGSVTLNKEDGTGEPLANASFTLFDELDKEIKTVTTDKKGQVTVKDLKPGNYYFLETAAPTGYLINTEKVEFTITDKATTAPKAEVVTATNYKGSVELIKVNETGEALADAQFKVMTEAGDTVKTELTSTKDGKVLVENLAPGNYYFEETAAPAGYVLNTTKVPFTIAEEAAGKPAIVDANATGKLSLTNYTASVEFNKISETNQPLEDAVFELTKADDKDFKKEVKSDKEGRVSVDGLAPGTYTFTETKAAPGYMLNTETIEFEIKPAVEGKPEVISLANFINYQGEILFHKVNGSLGVTRQLGAEATVNGGLKGAKFVLLPSETVPTLSNDSLAYSNEDIHEADENGWVHITGLAPGNYILREIEAPTDFITRTQEYEFEIPQEYQGNPGNTFQYMYNDVTFANYQGTVELTKTDSNDTPLAGAVFNIVDGDGEVIQKDLMSDEEGKIFAAGLAPGTYFFKEVKAPTGFVLNETQVEFTIATHSESGKSDVKGLTLKNYKGSAQLIKQDEAGKSLAGAIFKVTNQAGEDVQTNLTSNAQGEVVVENLAPGKYFFEETQAPTGYIQNDEKVSFEIADKASDQPVMVTGLSMTNYQGSAILTKVEDKNPLKKLANATFSLVDMDGKVINKELVTDKEGQISVTDLAPGTYYFVETSAPQGYDLDETPVKVDIKSVATGKPAVVMVAKTNKLTPTQPNKPDLPSTGKADKGNVPTNKESLPLTSSQSNVVLVVVGTGLVSLVVYVKRRKATKV